MSNEEQYVTKAEFLIALTRIDLCEADREGIRTKLSTVSTEVTDQGKHLAEVKAEVKALSAKQDAQTIILERLDKVMTGIIADPKVRLLAQMLIGAAIAYYAAKGHLPQ